MAPKDERPPAGSIPDADARVAVSRRDFLKTVGVGSLATGLIAPADAGAQAAVREIGPGEVPIELTINGRRYDLKVEPRVTLLDAVRNHLDMTGVKRVCDRGSCGACTMIVDNRTVYSCSVLAIEMQGKSIRTVEGLASGGELHPVQQAFCERDALMCGFCTPGFVMAAVALREGQASPTPEQARRGLDGNICRCGTYVRVLEAAMQAAPAAAAERDSLEPALSAHARNASERGWGPANAEEGARQPRAGVGPREQEEMGVRRG